MNLVNPLVRWRWLLVALLLVPAIARADPDYGGVYEALLVGVAASVLLLAGMLWVVIADYRAGQPGIGLANAVVTGLLLLGWLSSTVQGWLWLGLVLMTLLGLNGWLLARKNLRVAEQQLRLWLALGMVGLGWLVGAVLGVWLQWNPGSWDWLRGSGMLPWALIGLVLRLPGLVLLARAFFTRWPAEWPGQAAKLSLQTAGIAAAINAGIFLAELLAAGALADSSFDTWQTNIWALLQTSVISLLETVLVLLAVRWWMQRSGEIGK